jgi:hypothetical protein
MLAFSPTATEQNIVALQQQALDIHQYNTYTYTGITLKYDKSA